MQVVSACVQRNNGMDEGLDERSLDRTYLVFVQWVLFVPCAICLAPSQSGLGLEMKKKGGGPNGCRPLSYYDR
jgi:hypothetical protein